MPRVKITIRLRSSVPWLVLLFFVDSSQMLSGLKHVCIGSESHTFFMVSIRRPPHGEVWRICSTIFFLRGKLILCGAVLRAQASKKRGSIWHHSAVVCSRPYSKCFSLLTLCCQFTFLARGVFLCYLSVFNIWRGQAVQMTDASLTICLYSTSVHAKRSQFKACSHKCLFVWKHILSYAFLPTVQ